eukprot:788061-Ditylum_brightwellii.AAC.1
MKEEPVYISHPPMMGSFPREKVLKLDKNLYGQADALRMWYDKLRAGLEARGFTAYKADLDSKDIDTVLKSFKEDEDKYNWEMTEGGSMKEFLGSKANSLGDGAYKLTQEGLIDKILKATGMENCNPAVAPTSGPKPLGPDPHSKDIQLQD